MERTEREKLLEVIEQQVSSTILGGMEAEYEALERDGLIVINREGLPHFAHLTPAGEEYLERFRHSD